METRFIISDINNNEYYSEYGFKEFVFNARFFETKEEVVKFLKHSLDDDLTGRVLEIKEVIIF